MDTVLRIRYLAVIAVVFAAIGALLMFTVGAVTTIQAIGAIAGTGTEEAFSDEAALTATVKIVTALDQFLLGLFLIIFATGVHAIWIADQTEPAAQSRKPQWLTVTTVTDLKVQLLEVVAVIIAVFFLKLLLSITKVGELPWELLVLPAGVALLALSIWLIRRAGH